MFVVLDLDKTLADTAHREHLIAEEPKNWDAYWSQDLVWKDPVVEGAARVVLQLQELKYNLIIITGRTEDLRDVTMRWLLEKLNIALPDTHLLMRPNGNMLDAGEYKREQLLNFRTGLDNRDTGFILIDDDAAAGTQLCEFGLVLKAPECWPLLFPVPPEKKEV